MSIYSMWEKLSIEEAKEYNRKNANARWELFQKGIHTGCVGRRACENCGRVVSGTCMCVPIFTCPDCGEVTDETASLIITNIKYSNLDYTPTDSITLVGNNKVWKSSS